MNSGNLNQRECAYSRALVCLQRDCDCLQDVLEFLSGEKKRLSLQEVGDLYASLRSGGVNLKQVSAAMAQVCEARSGVDVNELGKLLKELDRRYFILQSAQWDFALLDRSREGCITEKDAKFLLKTVHGDRFTTESWMAFHHNRVKSEHGSEWRVSWEDIEIPLCDIPIASEGWLEKQKEEQLMREREDQLTREREEQLTREKEEQQLTREREEQLTREREKELVQERERNEPNASMKSTEPPTLEEEPAKSVQETVPVEEIPMSKKQIQLQTNLEQAVASEEIDKLEPAIKEVKKESVPNCTELLKKAENLLKKLHAAKNLRDATLARRLNALQQAITAVKKGGWEKDLEIEMEIANKLLEKLHRLEQRKRAVLELSQRVIAELKSYSNPPPLVHQVMSATFLLLGNPEKETKSWQATQILIGKTGKTSLKRRVSECSAENIALAVAKRALAMLKQYDFMTVQDTSLGSAAFYSWAEGMIEEVEELHIQSSTSH